MKHHIILVFSFLLCNNSYSFDQENLNKIQDFCRQYKPYQDIVINNQIVYRGWNSSYCELRYKIIKDIITPITSRRVMTLLDLGAAQGYFSFRLLYDFDLVSIMIENGQSALEATSEEAINFLKELCRYNQYRGNIILLNATLSPQTLYEFARHEHVDIILALSIIHHIYDWKNFIDALVQIGDVVIVEIPLPGIGDLSEMIGLNHLEEIHRYIQLIGGQYITQISRYYKDQMSAFYTIRSIPNSEKII